jgi:hypothetical protein
MAPLWLSVLGWEAIGTVAMSAGWIGFDVVVRRRHQHMRIMSRCSSRSSAVRWLCSWAWRRARSDVP